MFEVDQNQDEIKRIEKICIPLFLLTTFFGASKYIYISVKSYKKSAK